MSAYVLTLLPDHVLLRELVEFRARELTATAAGLARLAEVEARRLYLPAGHPSMYSYCVHELHLSEDAALKRIRVARMARQYRSIFPSLAAGRLSLSGVLLLTPHLTERNAEELIAAAAHKTNAEIALLLAQRFPRPDVATEVRSLTSCPVVPPAASPAEAGGGLFAPQPACTSEAQLAVRPVGMTTPEQVATPVASPPAPRPRVAPLSPERFALQLTMSQETQDKLRYAQALLGHAVPSGDIPQVLDRALDALIRQLEKRKFAATSRTRTGGRRGRPNERQVPAAIRRTVWERDGGRCSFTSDEGKRCESRTRLEFDHVTPVARGGLATAANLRLRCRGHNQLAAERAYGAGFMAHKRDEARRFRDRACDAARARKRGDSREAPSGNARGPAAHPDRG